MGSVLANDERVTLGDVCLMGTYGVAISIILMAIAPISRTILNVDSIYTLERLIVRSNIGDE